MSKSKGNVVAPQKVSDTLGARNPAPVGRLHRLLGRIVDLRRDPEARGRKLSPHPQYAALPAGQHLATSTRRRMPCRSPICWKSTAMRSPAWRNCRPKSSPHYEAYEFHPVVAKLQMYCSEDLGGFYLDILKDRLYTGGIDFAGAPFGANRDLAHHPVAAARDGADPVVHRRGSMAQSSPATRPMPTATRRSSRKPSTSCRRWPTPRRCWTNMRAMLVTSAPTSPSSWKKCA